MSASPAYERWTRQAGHGRDMFGGVRKAWRGGVLMRPWMLLVAAWLSACADVPTRWYLHGKSPEQLNTDHARCHQGALDLTNQAPGVNTGSAGSSLAATLLAAMFTANGAQLSYNNCMKASGYTPVE